MEKSCILFFLGLFFSTASICQIEVKANLPSVGIIQKAQLWNLTVVNSSSTTFESEVHFVLKDRMTGIDVGSATTGRVSIKPGVSQINFSNLNQVYYNSFPGSFDFRSSAFLPPGSYIGCYNLISSSEKIQFSQDCAEFDVEPLSPPLLVFPIDSSRLSQAPVQFNWSAPTPLSMFNYLNYDIIIAPLYEQQKPEEAIQFNVPFYSGKAINNSLIYPASGFHFELNTWYVWQVIARDNDHYAGKSEAWVFIIQPPKSDEERLVEFPYLKMKQANFLKGFAPNGILKISYENDTGAETIEIKIVDAKNPSTLILKKRIGLSSGENLIEIDLSRQHLKNDYGYVAELVNMRGERQRVLFELRKVEE